MAYYPIYHYGTPNGLGLFITFDWFDFLTDDGRLDGSSYTVSWAKQGDALKQVASGQFELNETIKEFISVKSNGYYDLALHQDVPWYDETFDYEESVYVGFLGNKAVNGTFSADVITGSIRNDTIRGDAGANVILGFEGDDKLYGGAGADLLDGNDGRNVLYGGAGNDAYYIENDTTTIVENKGEGSDTAYSFVSFTLGANIEKLWLLDDENLSATGNGLANTITGNNGDNVLDGGAGADSMFGDEGDDVFIVDNVRDKVLENAPDGRDLVKSSVTYSLSDNVEDMTLVGAKKINATGNELDNVLTGNAAANKLTGGEGADTFAFTVAPSAKNVDVVADFRHGEDLIQLARSVFAGLPAGELSDDMFWSGAGVTRAHDGSDRIIYDTRSGALFFDRDGSDTQFSAVRFATLTGSPDGLDAGDFVVA